MGSSSIVADVGQSLIRLLRDNLCPQPVPSPDAIGLCSPTDNGGVLLGLHLYDVRESDEIRATDRIQTEGGRQKDPPMYLSLFYMMTAYAASDVKFRAADDQLILGRAMQTLYDNPVIRHAAVSPERALEGLDMRVQMMNLPMEEKIRMWCFPNLPYRLSVFYRVSPVTLESARVRTVGRVVDLDVKGGAFRGGMDAGT